jgi:succinate-semialdehyde dehydrogenase/glutarate-semialdehyde dehydrogenase
MLASYQALVYNRLFINNTWVDTPEYFEVYNPATGQPITQVSNATPHHAGQAIAAAEHAFNGWAALPAKQRGQILRNWFNLINDNTDQLAALLTAEQGKPFIEARGEIEYGASFIEWFAEEARRTYGETIPTPVSSKRMFTIKQPVGVVAAITPWNFPVAMVTRKIAPALAAGCTVVLKPAEDTPLCALALAALAAKAGMPPGVFNVITTLQNVEVGKVLTSHTAVKKLSFTGSTQVGKLLMAQCATTVKKLSLELGGNAPCIVFDDADIDLAVKGTMASKYRNAGQTCVCANRILVQRNIYPAFIERFKAAVAQLHVGNGMQDGVTIGPLINRKAIDKVQRLLKDATDKGALVIAGGHTGMQGDLFFEPTIITGCTPAMQLSQEEIFGPVSCIYLFDTEAEAIALANDTPYGLAAYFFTQQVQRVFRVAEQLQYGIIGINEGLISHAEAPFGGIKESGFGKEGSFYGIEDYLVTKYLCLGNMQA